MYYVVQENLFREYHFQTLLECLKRGGLEYELVAYRPFVHHVSVKTDRKDVWFFGSVNAGMVLGHKDWNPGVLYNEKHNFDVYMKEYGDNLLNSDATTMVFDVIMLGWADDEYFIRPTRDTKTFESKVYERREWNDYVLELGTDVREQIRQETRMMFCTPKSNIQQEIRCWIVDGEPVTMSQYKIGRRVNMLNMDHNEEAYIFSKKMARIFSPSRAFVLDICLYNDEYKIVEINCINMSGFYDCDMSKLIQALEKAFDNGSITTRIAGTNESLPKASNETA